MELERTVGMSKKKQSTETVTNVFVCGFCTISNGFSMPLFLLFLSFLISLQCVAIVFDVINNSHIKFVSIEFCICDTVFTQPRPINEFLFFKGNKIGGA